MLETSLTGSHPLRCTRHKSQPVTHLCSESKCGSQPLLCKQCFHEQVNRHYHYDHQKSVVPFEEGVDAVCGSIRGQIVAVHKVYKSSIGRAEFSNLLSQLEKGQSLDSQLQERISSIKNQLDLELDLLVKQFHKAMLIEKQEYFKVLDNYQRTFSKNMQFLRNQTQSIIDFNNSIKYYANRNNLYLKMAKQVSKKSDWLAKTKKAIQNIGKIVENSNYSSELSNTFTIANSLKTDSWPVWKGQQSSNERSTQIKNLIKKSVQSWITVPEIKSIQNEGENGHGSLTNIGVSGLGRNYYLNGR